MTRFLLIRHAATDSIGVRLSGRTAGVHLNETGRAQALALAERLAPVRIAALYSSPLERAVETATPIAEWQHVPIVPSPDFLEIHFGEWTDRAFTELDGEAEFKRFNLFRSAARIPGGELMAEAQLRMINGLEKLRGQHEGQVVAVVSHSDLIKASVAYYAGIHLDLFQRLEISPASVSIIELGNDWVKIISVNGTGTLTG